MKRLLLALMLTATACLPARAGETTLPEAELAALQAAMQSHIEQNLIEGALFHLDPATGIVRPLYPAKAHPKIMPIGRYYYLCADFRDEAGKDVMVNFYAARDGDHYVIFHTDFEASEELEERVAGQSAVITN